MYSLSSRFCKGIRSVVHCGQTVQVQTHATNIPSSKENNDSASAFIEGFIHDKDHQNHHERTDRTTNTDGTFQCGFDTVVRFGVLAGAAWQLGRVAYKTHENAKGSNNKQRCLWHHNLSFHASASNSMVALHMLPKGNVSVDSDSSSSEDFSSLLSNSSSQSSSITQDSHGLLSCSDLSSDGENTSSDDEEEVHTLQQWAEATAQLCQKEACRKLTQQGIDASILGQKKLAQVLWRQAATAGHLPAMFNLGLAAARQRQEKRAERWYRRATDAGHGAAAYNLALLIDARPSRAEHAAEVRSLLEKAAESGVIRAQELLNSSSQSKSSLDDAGDCTIHVKMNKEDDPQCFHSTQQAPITKDTHVHSLHVSRSVPTKLNSFGCVSSQPILWYDSLNKQLEQKNVNFQIGDDSINIHPVSLTFLRRNSSFGTRDELLMKNFR